MARKFNLQPWRAQRREEQRKTFTYATIAIVIACALALAANYWYETNYIEQQEVAKEQIKSETAKLSKAKSEVERLTELNRQVNLQIEVIQGLQAQRGLVTEMLDYIAKNTPETIFLQSVDYQAGEIGKDGSVAIKGIAMNDSAVAQFIRNMEKFSYFSPPANVERITGTVGDEKSFTVPPNSEVKEFVIHVKVKREPTKTEGGQG